MNNLVGKHNQGRTPLEILQQWRTACLPTSSQKTGGGHGLSVLSRYAQLSHWASHPLLPLMVRKAARSADRRSCSSKTSPHQVMHPRVNVPRVELLRDRGPMATCDLPTTSATAPNEDALHQLKTLLQQDQSFANALSGTTTTEEAAHLAFEHGISVTPEAIWRQRGTLLEGGIPTWRG